MEVLGHLLRRLHRELGGLRRGDRWLRRELLGQRLPRLQRQLHPAQRGQRQPGVLPPDQRGPLRGACDSCSGCDSISFYKFSAINGHDVTLSLL